MKRSSHGLQSVPQEVVGRGVEAKGAAATQTSLDVLRAEHGPCSVVVRQVAFRGYDPAKGLVLGQETASERILDAVSPITKNTVGIWSVLDATQRARLIGYTPRLLSVLLDETGTLRELNERYDAQARRASVSKAQRERAARQAFREGRELRDDAARTARMYLGAETLNSDGFERAVGNADTEEKLARGMTELADYLDAFLAGMDAESLEVYEELGITASLTTQLRAGAAAVRQTADDLIDHNDQTRVTQRQLDTQDGRVLHVIGLIHGAFRNAARRDPTMLVPELGELKPIFERERRSSATEEKPDEPVPFQPVTPA